jgi:PAS domain S-box-containing protein
MFRLLRYFSLTSLPAFIGIALAIAFLYHHYATYHFISLEKQKHEDIANLLANDWFGNTDDIKDSLDELQEEFEKNLETLSIIHLEVFDLQGNNLFSHDDDHHDTHNIHFDQALKGQSSSHLQLRSQFNDKDVLLSYVPIVNNQGELIGIFELFSDATNPLTLMRKNQHILFVSMLGLLGLLYVILWTIVNRAANMIHESDRRNRSLIEAFPDLIFIIDKDGRFLEAKLDDAHPLLEEIVGRKLHDLSFIPKDVADLILGCVQTTLHTRHMQTAEYTLPSLDKMSDYETRFVALDDQRVLYISRDITDIKQQELALKENEQRYKEVARAAQRHARELELLDQIRSAIAKETELAELLKSVTESVSSVLGYPYVTLGLIKGEYLEIQHHVGYDHIAQAVSPRLDIDKGVMGRVIREKESALIIDVKADPDYYLGANQEVISEICVPLWHQDKVVGVLNVESERKVLGEAQLEILEKVADFVGLAIQRARLFDEVKSNEQTFRNLYTRSQMQADELLRQTDELVLLDTVRNMISSKLEIHAVYEAVAKAVTDMLGYKMVSISLVKDKNIEVQYEIGYPPSKTINSLRIDQGIMGRVVRSGEAELVEDVTLDPDYFAVTPGITSDICIPLKVNHKVAGLLTVESERKLYYGDFHILEKVGAYMSLAMEQAQLYSDLQSSESRYKNLIENASDMIYRTNLKGDFIFMNSMVKKLLGYDEHHVLQFNYLDLIRHDYRIKASEFYANQVKERNLNSYFEFPALHKDGHEVWIGQNVQLIIEQGRLIGFQAVARNITERKQMEEALLQQKEALSRANAELEQFAFVAAHDLQEPLRKIQAFGDRLNTKYKAALDEQGQDYLARMQNSADRMRNLISDLLAFAKVNKEESRELVDLNRILKEVSSDLQTHLEETQGEIKSTPLPNLLANPTQMRQLFQNLLGNAIKFKRPGVAPIVSVSAQRSFDGGWRIQIADNGIGFDESYKDRIFKVFQRLHSREQYEGTGMGLAIVQKIMTAHGGSINVSSQLNHGTTFTLLFPLQSTKAAVTNLSEVQT